MVLGGGGQSTWATYLRLTPWNSAALNENGEVDNDNREVILTLIIHWFGPQLFLPQCSKA